MTSVIITHLRLFTEALFGILSAVTEGSIKKCRGSERLLRRPSPRCTSTNCYDRFFKPARFLMLF